MRVWRLEGGWSFFVERVVSALALAACRNNGRRLDASDDLGGISATWRTRHSEDSLILVALSRSSALWGGAVADEERRGARGDEKMGGRNDENEVSRLWLYTT